MASRAKNKIFKGKSRKQPRLPDEEEEQEHVPIKSDPQIVDSPHDGNKEDIEDNEDDEESEFESDSNDDEEEEDEEEEEEEEKHEHDNNIIMIDKTDNTQSLTNTMETSQDHSFWKYNNNNYSYSTRLIERGSGSHPNVIMRGHVQSYLYLYHSIIDTPWIKLFFYGFLLFFLFNVFFGTIFHLINGVAWNGEDDKAVTWSDSFFFALQSMDTIGFGALIPNGDGGNWLVFIMSYAAGIFWTAFTGIVFAKLSRPSRLKRQFKFSEVAVVNHQMECFLPEFFDDPEDEDRLAEYEGVRWSEYGKYGIDESYPCLQFRFGDMRHTSRICDSDFHLIFFQRSTRNDDNIYEDYCMEEMDFDINRQKGRVRSMGPSIPLLSLPWVIVHKIDKLSPLYGMSKTDLINKKCEIIAIVDGIDEATSDNFQSWHSYTANEIYWNYRFKPMVKAVVKSNKQYLQIDYDRISLIKPISQKESKSAWSSLSSAKANNSMASLKSDKSAKSRKGSRTSKKRKKDKPSKPKINKK